MAAPLPGDSPGAAPTVWANQSPGTSFLVGPKALARKSNRSAPMLDRTIRHPRAERGLDLYETPTPAVEALLRVERLPHGIWEPAAGRGAIVRVLRDHNHSVIASDIHDYGFPLHFCRRFPDADEGSRRHRSDRFQPTLSDRHPVRGARARARAARDFAFEVGVLRRPSPASHSDSRTLRARSNSSLPPPSREHAQGRVDRPEGAAAPGAGLVHLEARLHRLNHCPPDQLGGPTQRLNKQTRPIAKRLATGISATEKVLHLRTSKRRPLWPTKSHR
jgi:hypothetical protein